MPRAATPGCRSQATLAVPRLDVGAEGEVVLRRPRLSLEPVEAEAGVSVQEVLQRHPGLQAAEVEGSVVLGRPKPRRAAEVEG
jgi:hypothetical protein